MRVFISINPEYQIRQQIFEGQQNLIETIGEFSKSVRWEEMNKFHLTLLFIGEVDKRKLDEIIKQLSSVKCKENINFKGTKIGAFPDLEKPRVFWVGLEDTNKKLIELFQKITNSLKPLCIEPDKKFHPHITIGRVKRPFRLIEKFSINTEYSFEISSFNLMQSTLTKEGSIYRLIKKFNLIY